MKTVRFFLLIFILAFTFSAIYAHAQDDKPEATIEVPPGMETKKVGQVNVVVPEGTEVRDKGGVIFIESTTQYVSRKFVEMEARFNQLETEQGKLKREIEQLIEAIDKIQQSSSILEEMESKTEE